MKSLTNSQPIAIVGLAFRFPGDLTDEESFWKFLLNKGDAVTSVDSDRWAVEQLKHPKRAEPGRSVTFSAGVLSKIDEFDASFFGISPREATLLDPQQRLLLELSWEAIESGGIKPSSLAGTNCAVFVGISGLDYGIRGLDDLSRMGSHSMTGNTLSVAANRISYIFDLHGPSMAVDTACSSSLVALNQACECLSAGHSSVALVGGVNLLLHPYPFVGFTKASMLSADGRCRAFGADGEGYVRAEGGAVVVLKPLKQAELDGNRIYGVIRATGVNADGGRKSGLTIPSVEGQIELMRDVAVRAGVRLDEIDYLEAHGTGTKVGDPIESNAIGSVYGKSRAAGSPLPIGSVKSNLGHLEPASGMAGLVKALLVLKNRAVPPSIHADILNPIINFSALNLEVVREIKPLGKLKRPLYVGINSFGFGGANAHVIVQEYRPKRTKKGPASPIALPVPLVFSGRGLEATKALAVRYATALKGKSSPYDIAHAAWHRRDWLEDRVVLADVLASDAASKLEAFSSGSEAPGLVCESALPDGAKLALVYSGNGAQWVGMGRVLLLESPEFFSTLESVDALIQEHAGFSVLEALQSDDPLGMADTAIAQPALFAVQVGVTQLLRHYGLMADAAVGHSVGEIAAAWAVGALSLEAAVRVIVARSQAQALTRGAGRMAAIGLSRVAMQAILDETGLSGAIEIAGENSPKNVTVSGELAALDVLKARVETQGGFFRLLDLDYAFHSRAMDPIRERLLDDLAELCVASGNGRFFSTVSASELDGECLDASYWWRNIREPVCFGPAIQAMAEMGYRVFVEIGPHAILQRYISESLEAIKIKGRVLSTLRRDDGSLWRLRETVLRAALLGSPLETQHYFPNHTAHHVELPTYPWQRQRYWSQSTVEGYRLIEREHIHPLLGYRLKESEASWENHLDPHILPYLADHKVGDAVVLPGAAFVEMALAASREWFGGEFYVIDQLDIVSPVVFDGEHARTLRLVFVPTEHRFRIEGRQRLSTDPWTLHAVGRMLGAPAQERLNRPTIPLPMGDQVYVDAEAHYQLVSQHGLDYGVSFRGIHTLTIDKGVIAGKLAWLGPSGLDQTGHILHPAVLDQCFQAVLGWFHAESQGQHDFVFLPVKVGRLTYFGGVATQLRAKLVRKSPRSVLVDFELLDESEQLVTSATGCRFRAASIHVKEKLPTLWSIRRKLLPHATDVVPATFPSTQKLADYVRRELAGPAVDEHRRYVNEIAPLVDILPVAFARDAIESVTVNSGQSLITETLVQSWRKAHPLVQWFVDLLIDEGVLTRESDAYSLAGETELPAAETIWRTLLGDCPVAMPELLLMARVGRHLPLLLRGEPLSDTDESSALLEQLYDQAPAYAFVNRSVVHAVENLVRNWPEHRRLRVLEISGGSESLPSKLLPLLPVGRFDYVIAETDINHIARLEAEYAEIDNITIAGINSDSLELSSQYALPNTYDLVILHHWLHRSPQPGRVLAALGQKMKSGGVLLLAERYPDRSANLMFGGDSSWWHATDDGSFQSSLLSPDDWLRLLAELGWQEPRVLEIPFAEQMKLGSYLVLATWEKSQTVSHSPEPASWLLATIDPSAKTLSESVSRRLRSLGQHSQSVTLPSAVDSLPDNLVLLAGIGQELNIDSVELGRQCGMVRDQLLAASRRPVPPRVWLLTCGGALADSDGDSKFHRPSSAVLWGLARVAMNEYPKLQVTLIDLPKASTDPAVLDALERDLLQPNGEQEIILTSDSRHGLRLQPAQLLQKVGAGDTAPDVASGWQLDFTLPGQLRNLLWRADKRKLLADDEVEIEACAAGLNFRDVMYAMGLLSDEALENGFAGASLGLEVSGRIRRCGSRVTRFAVNDEVVAFAGASFASHVVAPERAVAHKPTEWSFADAATIPTVFFTVWYSLKHLANVQVGERVLIHGAAGGVGIAAIQVARYLGAEIFATAGSAEKRDFVALLGADHVLDSRTLAFADDIMALTHGEGVDVVLNSLAGEAINRNLHVLRPMGRFLELGKRDFYENTHIGLRPFKDNISYFGIDADQLMKVRPEYAAKVFREVMALFETGVLRPLPHRVFSTDRIVDAFRHMQQAKQIGKVVIDLQISPSTIATEKTKQEFHAQSEGTYLITGGLSGFGLATAKWLAERGAGHLVLLGRRGKDTPGLQGDIDTIESLGSQVHVLGCDVTDRSQLASIFSVISRDFPPLRGVIHAAMVLDDGLLANLGADKFEYVLAPKLTGAWHLHELTQSIPLDFFVLYSSMTTYFGNPGQANYVAANAGLESLAQLRRNAGLPATAIAWGPISDVGVLTRNEAAREGLQARLGAAAITSNQALAMLGQILVADASGLAVMDIDWKSIARLLPSAENQRFEWLSRHAGKGQSSESSLDIRALIAGRSIEEVQGIISTALTAEVAEILRLPAERLDTTRSLYDLGLDSLMAVELALAVEKRFGVNLPPMIISENPSIARIAERLAARLTGNDVDVAETNGTQTLIEAMAAQHADGASPVAMEELALDVKTKTLNGAQLIQ